MSDLRHYTKQTSFEQQGIVPDPIIPDLGKFLLGNGLVDHKDLEIAEYYQKKLENQGRYRSLLEILVELSIVDQNALNQLIKEALRRERSQKIDGTSFSEQTNTEPFHTQSGILQSLQSIFDELGYILDAPNQIELLNRFSHMIVDRFGVDCILVFRLDKTTNSLVLSYSSQVIGAEFEPDDYKISIGSQSNIGRSVLTKQIIISNGLNDTDQQPLSYVLPETRSEVCIPIRADDKVIGVVDLQLSENGGLEEETISHVQSILNLISPSIQRFQLLESTNKILNELSVLYQAQQQFTQANTRASLFNQLWKLLKHFSYPANLFLINGEKIDVFVDSDHSIIGESNAGFIQLNGLTRSAIQEILLLQDYLLINEEGSHSNLTDELLAVINRIPYSSLVFIPLMENKILHGLIVVGSNQENALNHQSVQLYLNLAKLVSAALARLTNQERLEFQLQTLQIVDLISQSISSETNLEKLYRLIHEQVIHVMGGIDFMIALYDPNIDMIEIPYACEENQLLDVPPFPLGEGLTSIIIRSKQPLMLLENAVYRATELRAKVVGNPAKSWLGVPLLVAGQAIGAMIVQDLKEENRFDEKDQSMLSTIATQIATTIRNVRLISEASQQAERESYAKEITNKLWSSANIDSLLYTAIDELGREFNASRGEIRLEITEAELPR